MRHTATPGTWANVYRQARPDDTIVLATGNYGRMELARDFPATHPVTVAAARIGKATCTALIVTGTGTITRGILVKGQEDSA